MKDFSAVNDILQAAKNLDVSEEIMLLNKLSKDVLRKTRKANSGINKEYWLSLCKKTFTDVWDNPEDNIYNELLKR
ncbi:MAG: hypothetical protein HZA48_09995 [Planctomycetes bacterium]|nr:hypothetical protein [Planctomycetota bacterium]